MDPSRSIGVRNELFLSFARLLSGSCDSNPSEISFISISAGKDRHRRDWISLRSRPRIAINQFISIFSQPLNCTSCGNEMYSAEGSGSRSLYAYDQQKEDLKAERGLRKRHGRSKRVGDNDFERSMGCVPRKKSWKSWTFLHRTMCRFR